MNTIFLITISVFIITIVAFISIILSNIIDKITRYNKLISNSSNDNHHIHNHNGHNVSSKINNTLFWLVAGIMISAITLTAIEYKQQHDIDLTNNNIEDDSIIVLTPPSINSSAFIHFILQSDYNTIVASNVPAYIAGANQDLSQSINIPIQSVNTIQVYPGSIQLVIFINATNDDQLDNWIDTIDVQKFNISSPLRLTNTFRNTTMVHVNYTTTPYSCFGSTCLTQSTCFDSFACKCPVGRNGSYCEGVVNNCVDHQCLNGAECMSVIGNGTYTCDCPVGRNGTLCEGVVNNCVGHQCQNGGGCINVIGNSTYDCDCPIGRNGSYCEGVINNCVGHLCQNGGQCINVVGNKTYTCDCPTGRNGTRCEGVVNNCVEHSCQNGGGCINIIGNGTYGCDCPAGRNGTHCEGIINNCMGNQCLNGATCINVIGNGTYDCECPDFYNGDLCDTFISVQLFNYTFNNGTVSDDSCNRHQPITNTALRVANDGNGGLAVNSTTIAATTLGIIVPTPVNGFSLSFKFLFTSTSPTFSSLLINTTSPYSINTFQVGLNASQNLYITITNTTQFDATTVLLPNVWYSVIITLNQISSVLTYFLDGTLMFESSGWPIVPWLPPTTLITFHFPGYGPGSGGMLYDDLVLYNASMSLGSIVGRHELGENCFIEIDETSINDATMFRYSFEEPANGIAVSYNRLTAQALDGSGKNNHALIKSPATEITRVAATIKNSGTTRLSPNAPDNRWQLVPSFTVPISINSSFTFSFWILITTSTANKQIITTTSVGTSDSRGFLLQTNPFALKFGGLSSSFAIQDFTARTYSAASVYMHCIFSYDYVSKSTLLYVDGKPIVYTSSYIPSTNWSMGSDFDITIAGTVTIDDINYLNTSITPAIANYLYMNRTDSCYWKGCQHNGKCISTPDAHKCIGCQSPWNGTLCQHELCTENTCNGFGDCTAIKYAGIKHDAIRCVCGLGRDANSRCINSSSGSSSSGGSNNDIYQEVAVLNPYSTRPSLYTNIGSALNTYRYYGFSHNTTYSCNGVGGVKAFCFIYTRNQTDFRWILEAVDIPLIEWGSPSMRVYPAMGGNGTIFITSIRNTTNSLMTIIQIYKRDPLTTQWNVWNLTGLPTFSTTGSFTLILALSITDNGNRFSIYYVLDSIKTAIVYDWNGESYVQTASFDIGNPSMLLMSSNGKIMASDLKIYVETSPAVWTEIDFLIPDRVYSGTSSFEFSPDGSYIVETADRTRTIITNVLIQVYRVNTTSLTITKIFATEGTGAHINNYGTLATFNTTDVYDSRGSSFGWPIQIVRKIQLYYRTNTTSGYILSNVTGYINEKEASNGFLNDGLYRRYYNYLLLSNDAKEIYIHGYVGHGTTTVTVAAADYPKEYIFARNVDTTCNGTCASFDSCIYNELAGKHMCI